MRKLLVLAFTLIGLFASVYLTWAYTSSSHAMVCLGSGCDVVRASRYAYPFGVPLPVLGLVFYGLITALIVAEPHLPQRSETIWRTVSALAGAGLMFSAWLTYLEAFEIHAWCIWCVTQAIAVLLVFILSLGVSRSESPGGRTARYAMLIVAVVAAIPAMFYLVNREAQAAAPPPKSEQAQFVLQGPPELVRNDSHWTGNPNAKLTIVEFGDFQCPSCGVAEQTSRVIRDQFGDKVKFVFRQYPLETVHAYAFQAAKASECAGDQGKFWPMMETLYTNQTALTAPDLRKYANMLGLDTAKFNTCLEDPEVTKRIRTDIADGTGLQVRATPTFFLNGKKHEGALTLMDVAGAISAAQNESAQKTAEAR